MPDSLGRQSGPQDGPPKDESKDGGWLHGLSHAEIAQRARFEELLESPDRLMMLAVQHNEVRRTRDGQSQRMPKRRLISPNKQPVNQIRALLERQLYNLPAPAPKMTTVQPPRDRSSSRDGGGGRDKDVKGKAFGASMPPPGPRRRRKRWGWADSDKSDRDDPDDDEGDEEDEGEGEGEAGDGDVLMVDDGAEPRGGVAVGVKRAAESEPDDEEGDG